MLEREVIKDVEICGLLRYGVKARLGVGKLHIVEKGRTFFRQSLLRSAGLRGRVVRVELICPVVRCCFV